MANRTKYNLTWPDTISDFQIELWCIRQGKGWVEKQGRSLFTHFKEAQKLAWPTDDHHRWSDVLLKSFVDHDITVVMGCGDSNKTYSMGRFILIDWWANPENTLWLISSTEYRGAELRIWGKIKELFNRARDRHEFLVGTVLESMHCITTEEIDEDRERARSIQRGLILVPCKRGNQYVGLSSFVGVKSPRLRHAGDEVQHMAPGFLDAYANWYGKRDFKGIMAGNPTDVTDPLCTAGEPEEGWDNFVDTESDQEWTSKFFTAHTIALDGRSSPNFDYPNADTDPKFPYLIGPKKLNAVASTFGKDSWQWFNQCVGKPNKGLIGFRVVTRNICEQHRALEDAVWRDSEITSIYALDPNYGGDDRCVGGKVDMGTDIDGNQIIAIYPPEIIPVKANLKIEPEDQIAAHVKMRSGQLEVAPENIFYDSVGKGTLGFAFAKVFGANSPIPVDSGDRPTNRPVRYDLFVEDQQTGQKRLKRCDEHYSKFITEMWFSVREAIESEQVRGLPRDVMNELCLRIYRIVKGNRIEVEPKSGTPTRPGMKERIGFSPDLGDWISIAIEGCRQRQFKIKRLGAKIDSSFPRQPSALEKRAQAFAKLHKSRQLQNV